MAEFNCDHVTKARCSLRALGSIIETSAKELADYELTPRVSKHLLKYIEEQAGYVAELAKYLHDLEEE